MKTLREHEISGTFRKSRHGKKAGKAPSRVPTPPDHLTEEEAKIFKDIAKKMTKNDSLATLDTYTLEQYAVQMALFRKARHELSKPNAQYISTSARGVAPSPWTVILQKSNDALLRLGAKLGLNPQDRGRITKVERENEAKDSLLR